MSNILPALEQTEEGARQWARVMSIMYRHLVDEGEIHTDHALAIVLEFIASCSSNYRGSD